MQWLIDAVNWLFQEIGDVGETVTGWLPPSPLQWTLNIDNEVLAWVNWLIPVGEMVVIAQGWLAAIGIWYVVRVVLHWLKVSGGG